MTENVRKVVEQIIRDTARPAVVLDMQEAQTDIYDSKIGGKAYLPKDAEYPCSRGKNEDGKPMVLLCQLNLDKFPGYRYMPKKGMLQFFLAPDGNYGMDYDDYTKQDGFRVVYYENINYDRTSLKEPPTVSYDPSDMPFKKELRLTYRSTTLPLSSATDDFDNAYERALLETGIQLTEDECTDVYAVLEDKGEYYGWCEHLNYAQGDPRPQNYPELLLQINSDWSKAERIFWGDMGVAHFFITAEKLKEKDFSRVYYQWDCG